MSSSGTRVPSAEEEGAVGSPSRSPRPIGVRSGARTRSSGFNKELNDGD
jgi:hypothetical protein